MRTSGILLPITSLPSKYGIGCFSKEAYEFVDFLEKAKQTYWQILPLGPTSYGDSPYQSFSTFAGNPYFIDLTKLIEKGLLTAKECDLVDFGDNKSYVDYGKIYEGRFELLRTAYKRSKIEKDKDYKAFCKENEDWLFDYAAYMAIKDSFGGISFVEWPEDIRTREPKVLEAYVKKLQEEIGFYSYLQYEFYSQWKELKAYANKKGIKIIGDIPIYVSPDGSDVWANPELFQMEDGKPTAVAGCPPDGFSPTGQLWGNPLYDWDYHKKTGYKWWIKRMSHNNKLYDVIRIDHFRAFDQYYSIPAEDDTAEHGTWVDGPGYALFEAIEKAVGKIPIIAEDLGYITDTVRKLVKDTGFPNMKVLQFAFDSRDSSGPKDYLPYNYPNNCVVYTGTHDNETLCGWLTSITEEELRYVADYIGDVPFSTTIAQWHKERPMASSDGQCDKERPLASTDGQCDKERPMASTNAQCMKPALERICKGLIRAAHSSVADYCIIPLQDYLCLGNEARINTPSTTGDNWKWRYEQGVLTEELATEIADFTKLYGRDFQKVDDVVE